jgi:hypothetical protein
MPAALAPGVEAAAKVDEPRRLYAWVGALLAAGAVVWLSGWLALRGIDAGTQAWNSIWGLSGISFLFAFVPLPGFTSALLLGLARKGWVLGLLGVTGAAIGGTVAAGLLLALGHTGRAYLRKKATRNDRARRFLAWSRKAAKRWTYVGVFVLLIPQFIPRAAVLYAAVLAKLKAAPFLAVVLAGTFVRNLLMLVAFRLGWGFFT